VTIDPEFVRKTGLSTGKAITARYSMSGAYITLFPGDDVDTNMKKEEKEAVLSQTISQEFRDWVEKSIEEETQSLHELSHL
jgi:hypothetical protein